MNRAMLSGVLGIEDADVLHGQIGDMINICGSIRNEVGGSGNACRCLLTGSHVQARVNELSYAIKMTKSKIDIAHRGIKCSSEVIQVRQFLIGLFENLDGLSNAFHLIDDGLLNKYTKSLEEVLETYY